MINKKTKGMSRYEKMAVFAADPLPVRSLRAG